MTKYCVECGKKGGLIKNKLTIIEGLYYHNDCLPENIKNVRNPNSPEPRFEMEEGLDSDFENKTQFQKVSKETENSFSDIKFNFESDLEAILELTYVNPYKSKVRMFFGREADPKIYSRDYLQKSNNNFVHFKISPSFKKNNTTWVYGGSKEIGDNFEPGYTLLITLKEDYQPLRKYLIDYLRNYNFGCFPSSKTILCHSEKANPNENGAKIILRQIIQGIIQ